MIRRFFTTLGLIAALAGCHVTTGTPASAVRTPPQASVPAGRAMQVFDTVVNRVTPVAVEMCRARTRNTRCDFQIVVDSRPNLPPNAFQTLAKDGRPVIGFTQALIADAQNADELAFVLGHEAAHHIAGHIPQMQQSAAEGALLGAVVAGVLGLDSAAAGQVQQIGGTVGARRFSKEFELEADAIGARIAIRAGYDALRGAQFFNRIPDPGDRFLGTHPPNADRMRTVERVVAGG
jgi:predicted Zn-dependent protease